MDDIINNRKVYNMSFEIFFDESNKIDKMTSRYAYYGVVGWMKEERMAFEAFVKEKSITKELHFSEFRLNHIKAYLPCLQYCLDRIESNFYLVNVPEVLESGSSNGFNEALLRKLFYIKIPERLIYGLTRGHQQKDSIDIYVDRSDEYGSDTAGNICTDTLLEDILELMKDNTSLEIFKKNKISQIINDYTNHHIQLAKTLKEQLNAQAIYRGLDYKIENVRQIDSRESKSLQITDCLLGIIAFLIEQEYVALSPDISSDQMQAILEKISITQEEKELILGSYKYKKGRYILRSDLETLKNKEKLNQINRKLQITSFANIGKSELIYVFLKDNDNLNKFFKLNIFKWEENNSLKKKSLNNKEPKRIYISEYISQFFQYKTNFDNKNKQKILEYFYKDGITDKKQILKQLGYSSSMWHMINRYWDELNLPIEE